jgi:hypothetical protein
VALSLSGYQNRIVVFLVKDDSNYLLGYRLIYGLKGNLVEAMDVCWQQWLFLWYGSLP